ncbi:CocE/NonD family hydrolase [Nonomuraea sp. NPDC003707]
MRVVMQNVRGAFGSDGRFAAFQQERGTGCPRVPGCREQAGCDGRLATAGASYLDTCTRWAVGPYFDPQLEAMCLRLQPSPSAWRL